MSKLKKDKNSYVLTDDKDITLNRDASEKVQAISFNSDLARIITKSILPLKMVIISDYEIKDLSKLNLLEEDNVFIVGSCEQPTLFITVVKDVTNPKSKVEINLLLKINLLTLFQDKIFNFKNILIS